MPILKVLHPNKKDAFDDLPDAFEGIELPPDEKLLHSADFKRMVEKAVREAVGAIKLPEAPKSVTKEIVREIRVEVPSKDKRDLVEKSALDAALKKISELEKKLEETDRVARIPSFVPGGPGVIGIPPPEASTVGYVLTVDTDKKAKFKAATGGGGASPSGDTYTESNVTPDFSFDAQDTSLDEIANVLGSVIASLRTSGIVS